jgi:hypothetical protein
MDSITVGIREFRENLATYLLESEAPVATRDGETIGYFIPARRKRSEPERAALKEAAARFDALLAEKGLTEEEIVADFKALARDQAPMSVRKGLVLDANILIRAALGRRVRSFLEAAIRRLAWQCWIRSHCWCRWWIKHCIGISSRSRKSEWPFAMSKIGWWWL